ncbi:MAG TPA: N-acetylmuramoyl-L-alanine amidase, partial [Thermodesulfobacteriota bacterium]|nr:N-acetylmuramoyl-L-alanine amidase [Thermodesulfobacteriota bacterium]
EVRAFLTRKGDYFVPLADRLKIAREYGADLFISIHANGNANRKVRGTSIYCLSIKGASDTATQVLAQKENASDLIGGIATVASRRDLDTILLDLEQTHSINESLHLGGLALRELGAVNAVQFTQPRQAGFAVLKAHEFPAILVETAYVTNPSEEQLLRKKPFQEKLCSALTSAIRKFMPHLTVREETPSPGEERPRPRKGA